MKTETQQLVNNYYEWLKDMTTVANVSDDCAEITTPYLDRHNDAIQIYCQKKGEHSLLLSDDRYALDDLKMSGCNIFESPKRLVVMQQILNGFGVALNDGALEVETDFAEFPKAKHRLVQAILAVNDMFCLAQQTVLSVFAEDVRKWLTDSGIRFVPQVNFLGRTGYNNIFDLAIPAFGAQPERIIQAINNPSKSNVNNLIFKWADSRESRPLESRLYAFLNCNSGQVQAEALSALQNYGIRPVPWPDRESVREELAA